MPTVTILKDTGQTIAWIDCLNLKEIANKKLYRSTIPNSSAKSALGQKLTSGTVVPDVRYGPKAVIRTGSTINER